jgi:hypothetical protein
VLKASKAEVKAKTLVRLSFKSFELGIPFDDKDPTGMTIDPHSELLFKSHVAKIGKDDALEQITISSHEGGEKVRWIRTEGSCHEN